MPPAFAILRDTPFVSLTTFRRSGEGVPTAVWVAGDGADLIVITPAESGKVKRIRNNAAVELVPCSRSGKVQDGMARVSGLAEVVTDDTETARLRGILEQKYGIQYKITMVIERLFAGRQKPRVILRIRST